MKFKFALLKLVVFFIQSTAFALGGWTSGGGEFLKGVRNPWFLSNIKEVTYCIQLDEKDFGVDKPIIEDTITRAFDFWRSEFSQLVASPSVKLGSVKIATQSFLLSSCNSKTDLTFQFGVLEQGQKKFLKDPSNYAAIAVRTDYINKEMRDKGFIYVSAVSGSLAYNPDGAVKNAWARKNHMLYLTLVHELGHVFGLPHMGSYGELMSEGFVEAILTSSKLNEDSAKIENPTHFFSFPLQTEIICASEPLLSIWREYFDLSSLEKCIQIKFDHVAGNQLFAATKLTVYAGPEEKRAENLIAEDEINLQRYFPTFLNLIWLPKDQQVFLKQEQLGGDMPNVLGISLLSISKSGKLRSIRSSKQNAITVRLKQGKSGFTIDGVGSNGEIITIL